MISRVGCKLLTITICLCCRLHATHERNVRLFAALLVSNALDLKTRLDLDESRKCSRKIVIASKFGRSGDKLNNLRATFCTESFRQILWIIQLGLFGGSLWKGYCSKIFFKYNTKLRSLSISWVSLSLEHTWNSLGTVVFTYCFKQRNSTITCRHKGWVGKILFSCLYSSWT